MIRLPILGALVLVVVFATGSVTSAAAAASGSMHTITRVASTIPPNGDLNPYGVAIVPRTIGKLGAGNVLVSNFNDSQNLQGTGTTIVQISPSGGRSIFAHLTPTSLPGPCPGGIGLTTALVALRSGFVIVGSLPTKDGTAATAKAGCLIVLNSAGTPVETFSGPPINGPWDMTAVDSSTAPVLFVTNVLNGTVAGSPNVVFGGTVVRMKLCIQRDKPPLLMHSTIIGSHFPERTDPAALVIGPTGVGFLNGTLYVADSLHNRIAAIPNALTRATTDGMGATVSEGGALNDPLGLAIAPNDNIVTVNGNDGNAVETTPAGKQVAVVTLDTTGSPPGAGTLFGLAFAPNNGGLYFVDDGSNTLNLLH